ncbi:MAG TPA: ACP S-malonyltransferase [Pirellulales bacterium]|jgi:[acyl-carrier-protein] S-malonyltransferase|nr:ACP S-malonyltransferase [Pirellulales bacterium]
MSTAFLFPGQGAQTVGMGRELAASAPEAKMVFEKANEILGYDLAKICFEGPAEKLNSTVYSQPALFVTSVAALAVMNERESDVVENCRYTAGLSLGEYTALFFSGVLDFGDALRVVAERGLAMQAASDACPSGMVTILGLNREQIEQLCRECAQGEVLQVANLLGPGTIAVSGAKAACERIAAAAMTAGAMKTVPLAVAGAFHTPLMQPAEERLSAALKNVHLKQPSIPVISNVDARPHDDPEEIRRLLVQQVVSPVLWEDSVRWMVGQGVVKIYEVGPGKVLRGLVKRIERKVECVGAMDG